MWNHDPPLEALTAVLMEHAPVVAAEGALYKVVYEGYEHHEVSY